MKASENMIYNYRLGLVYAKMHRSEEKNNPNAANVKTKNLYKNARIKSQFYHSRSARCSNHIPSHRPRYNRRTLLGCKFSRQNLARSLLIQPTQVRLPTDGNNSGEDIAELRRHIHEAECRHGRPELNAVGDTDGESLLQALPGFF